MSKIIKLLNRRSKDDQQSQNLKFNNKRSTTVEFRTYELTINVKIQISR